MWQRTLEIKANALRSVRQSSLYTSLREYYSDPEQYDMSVLNNYLPKLARVTQQLIESRIIDMEPIYIDQKIIDHVMLSMSDSMTAVGVKEFPGTVVGGKLFTDNSGPAERIMRLSSIHCPDLNTLPLQRGLICPPDPFVVQEGVDGPIELIRALGFDTRAALPNHPEKCLCVYLFLDFDHAQRLNSIGRGLWPVAIPRWWLPGESLLQLYTSLCNADADRDQPYLVSSWRLGVWAYELLLSLFRYMDESLNKTSNAELNTKERKTAYRMGIAPRIQVMYWRKYEAKSEPSGNPEKQIEFSCRWPVREHVRHYKSGKTVTIKSYVKGPEDKPLKEAVPRVHVAAR